VFSSVGAGTLVSPDYSFTASGVVSSYFVLTVEVSSDPMELF